MARKTPGMEKKSSHTPILSVGPFQEDHAILSEILAGSDSPLAEASKWTLHVALTVAEAIAALQTDNIPIVVCERDLGIESWREFWSQAAALAHPPCLIVTSRLADEYLWAEALNLGAYDVLPKPLVPAEVVRTLTQARVFRTQARQSRNRPLSAVGHAQPAPRSHRGVPA